MELCHSKRLPCEYDQLLPPNPTLPLTSEDAIELKLLIDVLLLLLDVGRTIDSS